MSLCVSHYDCDHISCLRICIDALLVFSYVELCVWCVCVCVCLTWPVFLWVGLLC